MSEAHDTGPLSSPPAEPAGADLSSAQERKTLVDDIVREMRRDSVKEAASAKLNKANVARLVAQFFKHPATLLVLGFTLTGMVGLKLQRGEWDRQQRRLIEIREADLKYAVLDDVLKAVGARNSTAIAIVEPLLGRNIGSRLRPEEIERFRDWQKAAYDWRVNSQVLRLKLQSHIRHPDAAAHFKEISLIGQKINTNIIRLSEHLRANNWVSDQESNDEIDEIIDAIEDTDKDLNKLKDVITDEAKSSINGGSQ